MNVVVIKLLSVIVSALSGSIGALVMHKLKEKKYINNNRFSYKFADLLENEIINTEKIQRQFENADLNEEFFEMAESFYSEYLLDDIKNLKLKDISIFEDLFFGMKESIQYIVADGVSDFSRSSLLDIPANLIFGDDQIHTISQNLAKNFAAFYENTDAVELSTKKVFESISDIKIETIISTELNESINKNLFLYSKKMPKLIKDKYDSALDELIVKSLDSIDIEKHIKEVNEKIDNERLYVAMGINKSEFADEIIKDIREFFATDYGKGIFIDAIDGIFDYLQFSKKSLHDIIDDEYENEIKETVHKYEDGIIDELTKWQDGLNVEILDGLKLAVDKYVDDSKLSEKISESIIEEYNKQKSSDKYGKLLKESYNDIDETDKVDNYIINEISGKFSKLLFKDFISNLGDDFSANNVYAKFMADLNSDENKISKKIIDNFLNAKVKEIVNIDLSKLFRERYRYAFVDYIKDRVFYNTEVYENLIEKFSDIISKKKSFCFSEIFNENDIEKIANILKVDIADSYFNNDKNLKSIESTIKKYVEDKTLADFLRIFFESDNSVRKMLSDDFNSILNIMFNKNMDRIGEKRVSEILNRVSDSENLNNNTASVFRKIMSKALRSISKGFTYSKVYSYFDKKPRAEFNKFFGKISAYANKEIMIFGSIIAALVTGTMTYTYNVFSDSYLTNYIFLIFTAIISFAIGIGIDNVFINGCYFKKKKIHYKGLRGLYKVKHRVSDLISEGVKSLDAEDESIDDRDAEQIVKIKYDIKQCIMEDDSKIISDMLINNVNESSDEFIDYFLKFVESEKDSIVKKYYADIALLRIKDIFNRKNIALLTEKIDQDKKNGIKQYAEFVFEFLGSEKFNEICPDACSKEILDEFDNYIYQNYSKLFRDFENPFKLGEYFDDKTKLNFEDNQSLRDVFSIEKLDNLEGKIFNNIYYNLFSDKKIELFSKKASVKITDKYFSGKKVEDFLSRRAKIMITSMFYKLFADTVYTARNELANNYKESVVEISKNIFMKLNNRETRKFDKLGAEKIIEVILDEFYKQELEKIFKNNLEKLYEPAKEYTVNILSLKVKDIKLEVSEKLLSDNVNKIIRKEHGQALAYTKLGLVFNKYFTYVLDSKYRGYKKYVFDFKISKFMGYHKRDFKNILKKITSHYIDEKNLVLENSIEIRQNIYQSILSDINLSELFKCNNNEKDEFYRNLANLDESCDFVNLAVITIYNSIYHYLEELDIVKSFIDSDAIMRDLNLVFEKMFDRNKLSNIIISSVKKKFDNGIPYAISMKFDEETKKYILDMIIDEIYLGINDYMDPIYHNLNISDIIKKDLEAISANEFNKLFEYKDINIEV